MLQTLAIKNRTEGKKREEITTNTTPGTFCLQVPGTKKQPVAISLYCHLLRRQLTFFPPWIVSWVLSFEYTLFTTSHHLTSSHNPRQMNLVALALG